MLLISSPAVIWTGLFGTSPYMTLSVATSVPEEFILLLMEALNLKVVELQKV